MITRRHLFVASAGAAACAVGAKVFAQEIAVEVPEFVIEGNLPPLPDDLAEFASEPPAPYTELAQKGTGKPTDEEITRAYEILANSPYDTSHVDVASYFLNLTGSDAKYRREWPVRANPLIYHFFSATGTKPEGDVTAWCGAAMNWFLLRGQAKSQFEVGTAPGSFSVSGGPFSKENIKKYSTGSASSGSFRCWEPIKGDPKRGDLVVLKDKGTDAMTKYCKGTGHVTIFMEKKENDRALVLGGNQSEKGSNGAITLANMYLGPGSRFYRYVSPKVA